MIRTFKHKGLENFFKTGQAKGVKTDQVKKLRQILAVLNTATCIEDIESVKPFRCHALSGRRKKEHAVWVNKNWRVTFVVEDSHIYLVNYEDYHDGKLRR